jgi:hypothetical protein
MAGLVALTASKALSPGPACPVVMWALTMAELSHDEGKGCVLVCCRVWCFRRGAHAMGACGSVLRSCPYGHHFLQYALSIVTTRK